MEGKEVEGREVLSLMVRRSEWSRIWSGETGDMGLFTKGALETDQSLWTLTV